MTTVRVMTHPFQHARPDPTRTARPIEVLPPVEVTTDRLNFRPLAMADRPQVLAALDRTRAALAHRLPLNRPTQDPHACGQTESDDQLFTRWVETAIDSDNNRSAWRRAAFLDDGSFVGCFNLIKVQRGLDWSCETNFWVDAAHQSLGYAREGVQALLHLATADLPVGLGRHRVTAMIQPDNNASRRIAQSLGFKETGRADLLHINGTDHTHLEYAYTP